MIPTTTTTAAAAAAAPNLSRFLAANYTSIKSLHPGEGRRQLRLRVAEKFWALSAEDKETYAQLAPLSEDEVDGALFSTDDDPLDDASIEAPGLGVLVRTDFSDEAAWQAFLAKLKEAESEFASGAEAPMDVEENEAAADAVEDDEDEGEDEGAVAAEALETETSGPAPIFHVLDPALSNPVRPLLTGTSNLAALRFLNDVDVRRIPDPPAGTKRIKPPSRLVDYHGWQETYVGKTVWVYDHKSNTDQCVRLVSQQSANMYGTATADSWRARVSHICELQVNLASGAMSIDFGGMDRWDYPERVRNMAEAEQSAP